MNSRVLSAERFSNWDISITFFVLSLPFRPRYFSSVKRVKCTIDVCILLDNRINRNYNWNLLSHKSFSVLLRVRPLDPSLSFGLTLTFYNIFIIAANARMLPPLGHTLSATRDPWMQIKSIFLRGSWISVDNTLNFPLFVCEHEKCANGWKKCFSSD